MLHRGRGRVEKGRFAAAGIRNKLEGVLGNDFSDDVPCVHYILEVHDVPDVHYGHYVHDVDDVDDVDDVRDVGADDDDEGRVQGLGQGEGLLRRQPLPLPRTPGRLPEKYFKIQ